MSIEIKRGVKWFRPMLVKLDLLINNHEEAIKLAEALQRLSYPNEACEIRDFIRLEEQDMKAHQTLGYICDPDEKYKEGYLE